MSFTDKPYISVEIISDDSDDVFVQVAVDQGADRNFCYPYCTEGSTHYRRHPIVLNNDYVYGLGCSSLYGLLKERRVFERRGLKIISWFMHCDQDGSFASAQASVPPRNPEYVGRIPLPSLNYDECGADLELCRNIGEVIIRHLPVPDPALDFDRHITSLPFYKSPPKNSLVVSLTDRNKNPALRIEGETYQHSPTRRSYRRIDVDECTGQESDTLAYHIGEEMALNVLCSWPMTDYPHWPLIDLFVELVEEDGRQVIVMTEDVKAENAHHRDFLEELPLETVHFNPDKDYTDDYIHYGRLILKHLGLDDG